MVPQRSKRPARSHSQRVPSGSTLIELVVVMLLFGISLLVVIPAFPRSRTGAEAGAYELARLLERSRRAAAERGQRVATEVNLATGVFRMDAEGTGAQNSTRLEAGHLPWSGRVGAGTAEEGSPVIVRFDPLGRAEGGPVRLRDAEGHHRTVVVSRWTGRVRVEKR